MVRELTLYIPGRMSSSRDEARDERMNRQDTGWERGEEKYLFKLEEEEKVKPKSTTGVFGLDRRRSEDWSGRTAGR